MEDGRGIIKGQHVTPVKRQRARDLRGEMTYAERVLWHHIRAHRLAGLGFRRQQPIAGFIVDFYCHAARLVIEVDGPIHATQPEYDAARDQVLAAHGLRLLRIPNDDILHNLPAVLARITAASPPSSPPATT